MEASTPITITGITGEPYSLTMKIDGGASSELSSVMECDETDNETFFVVGTGCGGE